MEAKGRVKDIMRTLTGKVVVTFELENIRPSMLENMSDKDLRITAVKWREKRSLNANAYCWALITQIAAEVKSTPQEIYDQMILDYSLPEKDENGPIIITVRGDVDMEHIKGHWKFYQASSDWKWKSFVKMIGSSEMDTKMMSDFLDMVIDEAEGLGIDTATPDEVERMKALWRPEKS